MKHFLTFSLLLLSIGLFAQPANDDCSGIFNLGPAPVCPPNILYNNVGATESNIGFDNFPPCFVGNPARDVWFSFVAVDTILDYRITVTGCPDPALGLASMINPQIAIYRGDCEFDGLQLLECRSATAGETMVEIDLVGLTPGITYFIRINDWSPSGTPNSGAFKLCIIKKPPITTIDQGMSTACSGTLCDTGGPDDDYGNNENHVFTICPTLPHNCINFTLEYFNIENVGDVLTFYNGPNTSSPVIGNLNGAGSVFNNVTNGGVCYSVSASSGCLTIKFTSNSAAAYEGFCGSWECTTDACQPVVPITVDASAAPDDIVQSVVSGQTVITVTDINCDQGSVGTFLAGDNTNLGMEKGMLLTSGQAGPVANPATIFASTGNGFPGDDDLDYLSTISGNSSLSQDACIVELDVFAATDEITFEYIFGSEEYPEFVNTTFNDIFAFLVSGPGITGDPNIGDQENIATLPDGTFIQINSVNPSSNWQYYRNNQTGPSVVYDGLTSDSLGVKKSLTAKIQTIPCNTYHLKFAIADRGDSAYDSGVFISEIKGGSPNLGINYLNGIKYLVEECSALPDLITVSLNTVVTQPTVYNVVIGGNAILGVDYDLNIPSTLTFTPTETGFSFPIQALADGLPEGIDTIEIKLTRDFGCGEVVLATLIIEIHDKLDVNILNALQDTVLVCEGNCVQLQGDGAADYFWQPPGLFSNASISNPTVCPDTSQWIKVTGTLGICTDIDSAYLNVINPVVNINPGTLNACQGDTITLVANNNVNNSNLQWSSFSIPIQNPDNPVLTFVPPANLNSIFVSVSVNVAGCTATDNISINVDNFSFPKVANDTVICQNYSVDLGQDIVGSSTNFSWTPTTNLSPGGNVSGPIATPVVTTTYTLIASSASGACKDTAKVTITVIPVDISIQNPDTTFICLGDTITLNTVSSTQGVGVTWSPQINMIQLTPQQVLVYPDETTWYYSTLQTGNCVVVDSVLVYVDSLPDLSISAIPDKASYCQGEEVTLVSPTYEPANFPGIDLMWEPTQPGVLTPDSFLNLVFLAVETYTYIRTTTVHACVSVDSIPIKVVPVASISIEPAIETICQGESVQFTVMADPGVTELSWTPPNGLSCTTCPDPIASPPVTTTYNVEGKFEGCPVGASATIIVTPGPQFNFPQNAFVCPGDPITLNSFNDPNATYVWTSSDNSLNSTAAQPTVSPLATTTYFLTATRGNCIVLSQITVEVPLDFTITISNDSTVCAGNPVTLKATATQQNINFTWKDVNGNTLQTGPTFSVNPVFETSYFLSASDPAGCFTHTDDATISVFPNFFLTHSNDTTVQAGLPVTLKASANLPGVTFKWTDASGVQIGTDPQVTVSSCQTATYNVTATDPAGCYPVTRTITVNVLAGFTINEVTLTELGNVDSMLYEGEEYKLTVNTTPAVLQGAKYEWYLNGTLVATTTDSTSGTLNLPEVGEDIPITYGVVITNDKGCADSKQNETVLLDNPVAIPNVFTPNEDQLNPNFTIISKVPVEIIDFKVWNRWGQMVYNNEGGSAGWDGMQKGEPAASDVYVYYIMYKITGGTIKPIVKRGDVTLLR